MDIVDFFGKMTIDSIRSTQSIVRGALHRVSRAAGNVYFEHLKWRRRELDYFWRTSERFSRFSPSFLLELSKEGHPETVLLDKAEKEYQKLIQGIGPSDQQEEAKSNSNSEPKNHSEQEFHQREFTNVDQNSQQSTNF
ncbi:hypothetical protein DAPPUDRAFT_233811 [Daphnia pulex]|uniref:Uncharacterized protein n=1 Tax=Daphnia pulex TaxID=6669 RepID=E9FVT3_DAPPU|nr:hypothetical protein DAPPUDRAFT_233811 [Daphnia pulex]|eukprot:EFX89050.1 hypothetical protein DAPPUDRAFT_233811 [Daphnia pulex]